MRTQRSFTSRPASVREARRYVTEQIGDAPRTVLENLALAVSELATNCVRHAGTDFTVAVEVTGAAVRVEVADRGAGTPTVRAPGPSETSGRGLRLLGEISDAWGITGAGGTPGKTVWFTMRLSSALQDAG